MKFIENGLEYIINYFEKIIFWNKTNIKSYLKKLFYYQMNVVIKKFVMIKNINNEIY